MRTRRRRADVSLRDVVGRLGGRGRGAAKLTGRRAMTPSERAKALQLFAWRMELAALREDIVAFNTVWSDVLAVRGRMVPDG